MSKFKQLASLLGISDRQLRRYAESGKVVGVYTTKGGHWRLRGALTEARVERAKKSLRLTPTIAINRRKAHFKRANEIIKDVQRQWKQTFKAPIKKKKRFGDKLRVPKQPLPGEAVQTDLFTI